jgi:peroxiredoxin
MYCKEIILLLLMIWMSFTYVLPISAQSLDSLKQAKILDLENDSKGYIVRINDSAPDFQMKFLQGDSILLSSLRGKVVVLQFTASWCGVCRKEMPHIENEIWQKYKNNDLVIIGVDRDESLEKVIPFINQVGVTYPIALDPGSVIFTMFANKESGVTRNVVIDKEGKIAYLTRLYDEVEFSNMKKVIDLLLQ